MNNISKKIHILMSSSKMYKSTIAAAAVCMFIAICITIKTAMPARAIFKKMKAFIKNFQKDDYEKQPVLNIKNKDSETIETTVVIENPLDLENKYEEITKSEDIDVLDIGNSSSSESGSILSNSSTEREYPTGSVGSLFNMKFSGKMDDFPIEDKEFIEALSLISYYDDSDSDSDEDDCNHLVVRSDNDFKAQELDAFSFDVNNQTFEAFYADGFSTIEILVSEIADYLSANNYIQEYGLKNINITKKAYVEGSKDENRHKTIVIRKSPNIEASNKVKLSCLGDSKKCSKAAKDLIRLASRFSFTVPDGGVQYKGLIEDFKKMKDMFDRDESLDVFKYGFSADNILGENCFTYSLNDKEEVEVGVTLVTNISLHKDVFPMEDDISMLCNYSIVCTVFPYNVEDMLQVIEDDGSDHLTEKEKVFLRGVARSAQISVE